MRERMSPHECSKRHDKMPKVGANPNKDEDEEEEEE